MLFCPESPLSTLQTLQTHLLRSSPQVPRFSLSFSFSSSILTSLLKSSSLVALTYTRRNTSDVRYKSSAGLSRAPKSWYNFINGSSAASWGKSCTLNIQSSDFVQGALLWKPLSSRSVGCRPSKPRPDHLGRGFDVSTTFHSCSRPQNAISSQRVWTVCRKTRAVDGCFREVLPISGGGFRAIIIHAFVQLFHFTSHSVLSTLQKWD